MERNAHRYCHILCASWSHSFEINSDGPFHSFVRVCIRLRYPSLLSRPGQARFDCWNATNENLCDLGAHGAWLYKFIWSHGSLLRWDGFYEKAYSRVGCSLHGTVGSPGRYDSSYWPDCWRWWHCLDARLVLLWTHCDNLCRVYRMQVRYLRQIYLLISPSVDGNTWRWNFSFYSWGLRQP